MTPMKTKEVAERTKLRLATKLPLAMAKAKSYKLPADIEKNILSKISITNCELVCL